MTITPSDLQAQFARDFANDDPTVLQYSVDRAYRQLGDAWGDNTDGLLDDGATYLAAHLAMIAKMGAHGPAGQVQSKKVGDLSVTYAAPAATPSPGSFSATAYGLEFLRMMYTIPGARIYVDPSDNVYDGVANPFEVDGPGDGFGSDGFGDGV